MSPPAIRRHTLYLSDQEILYVERAVRIFAETMKTQAVPPSPRETDIMGHTHSAIVAHTHCRCPTPPE